MKTCATPLVVNNNKKLRNHLIGYLLSASSHFNNSL